MAQQVKVPTVGESITEVTIANWLKKDGDVVKMDEVIAELESDKATFELTAPQAGILKINKAKGEVVPIGTVICEIADGGAATTPTPKAETKTTETATPKATVASVRPALADCHCKTFAVVFWLWFSEQRGNQQGVVDDRQNRHCPHQSACTPSLIK